MNAYACRTTGSDKSGMWYTRGGVSAFIKMLFPLRSLWEIYWGKTITFYSEMLILIWLFTGGRFSQALWDSEHQNSPEHEDTDQLWVSHLSGDHTESKPWRDLPGHLNTCWPIRCWPIRCIHRGQQLQCQNWLLQIQGVSEVKRYFFLRRIHS